MNVSLPSILEPIKLWSSSEVFGHMPCPVPDANGIYAWYFKNIPDSVPTDDCHQRNGLVLLYVGIAPSTAKSASNLRNRIRRHYNGTARVSTLRFSLGCVLADEIGIEFWSKGRGLYLGETEENLSQWMEENAFVTWMLHPEPWLIESDIIRELSLPLNLKGNTRHPFREHLRDLRKKAREEAQSRV